MKDGYGNHIDNPEPVVGRQTPQRSGQPDHGADDRPHQSSTADQGSGQDEPFESVGRPQRTDAAGQHTKPQMTQGKVDPVVLSGDGAAGPGIGNGLDQDEP